MVRHVGALVALVLSLVAVPPAWAAVTHTNAVAETMPALPAAGTPFTDPDLGGLVLRLHDASTGLHAPYIRPEYSQNFVWNANGSLLLLMTGDAEWIVDGRTFAFLHEVACGPFPATCENLRWDASDPLKLWYSGQDCQSGSGCQADSDGQTCGNQTNRYGVFRRYQLRRAGDGTYSGTRHLHYCATEYGNNQFERNESWQMTSDDGRYVAVVAINPGTSLYESFRLDLSTTPATKGAVVVSPSGRSPDFTAVSPSGTYLLLQYAEGARSAGNPHGLEAYNPSTGAFVGQVSPSIGHADFIQDATGTEWAVQTMASTAGVCYGGTNYLSKARIPDGMPYSGGSPDCALALSSGATVHLLQMNDFIDVHISCRNLDAPTFCVVSTYSGIEDWPEWGNGSNLPAFYDEVFSLYLDSTLTTPHVERWVHHRSSVEWLSGRDAGSNCNTANSDDESYYSQPHAVPSPDGQRIAYGSNWRRICTTDPVVRETYVIFTTGTADQTAPATPQNPRSP